MNIKQKLISLALVAVFSMGVGVLAVQNTFAEPPPGGNASGDGNTSNATCGGVKTAIISCSQDNGGATAKDSAIWGVLLIVLNIMTGGIGILAVGGIVYGSILYTSAGDSSEQTKKAIEIIRNVVIGIVAYGLMYLVLNYLIPGGIFS